MITVQTIGELRQQLQQWRRQGQRTALVPTMGNLHAGHLKLVEKANTLADRSVASIFVNPAQFGPNEDFDSYPRTLQPDSEKLADRNLDLLFAPATREIYPQGSQQTTWVEVPEISNILCGASRPGFFRGVATVVSKLFNLFQPDTAVFGEKDWQQLQVIRRMTRDLNFSIDIVGVATERESDGLAMSSRNGYLTPEQRTLAPQLHATLQQLAQAIRDGNHHYSALEQAACRQLQQQGLKPDYVAVRDATSLDLPNGDNDNLRILAAAFLGKARLIDNIPVSGA